mgnify:CR=1 FL=1
MRNNYILIGYMGCGKSTIGKKMSEILNIKLVDTDAWIEERQGMTVSEIFATKGELFFRDLETGALKELLEEKETMVISVGGGLPVREENRSLLQQLGQVIYLKAQPETIYNRIKGDTTRPLLQTENPMEKIREMLGQREEKYQVVADKIVTVDDKDLSEILDEILEAVKE